MEMEYSESTTRDTLALDFRAATAEELALPGEREENNTMRKMVQHFRGASLNLMKKLKVRAPKHAEQSRVLASLGLGKLTAIEGRAQLLSPEAVNRAIHALAIQALTTEYQVLMKSLVKLPSPGKPIYDPHGDGEHEDPESERKHLRTLPKRRMENFPGQREYIASLPRYTRITEEMRLVHYYTAEAKQFHEVGPFSKDQPEAPCTKCGVKIKMIDHYGRDGINFSSLAVSAHPLFREHRPPRAVLKLLVSTLNWKTDVRQRVLGTNKWTRGTRETGRNFHDDTTTIKLCLPMFSVFVVYAQIEARSIT